MIGARLLEMFTGKVIVMMVLVMILSSYLTLATTARQQEQGLRTLDQIFCSKISGIWDIHYISNRLSICILCVKVGIDMSFNFVVYRIALHM